MLDEECYVVRWVLRRGDERYVFMQSNNKYLSKQYFNIITNKSIVIQK